MPKFPVTVTQVFRVERTATIEVEADDMESAVESVASGEVDLPEHDADVWEEFFELQNEYQEPAA